MNLIKTLPKLALITIIAVALQLLTTILFTWTVDLQYGDSNMIMMIIAFSTELIILALGVLLFTWKPSNPTKNVWTKTAGIFLVMLAILGVIYTAQNGNQSSAQTEDPNVTGQEPVTITKIQGQNNLQYQGFRIKNISLEEIKLASVPTIEISNNQASSKILICDPHNAQATEECAPEYWDVKRFCNAEQVIAKDGDCEIWLKTKDLNKQQLANAKLGVDAGKLSVTAQTSQNKGISEIKKDFDLTYRLSLYVGGDFKQAGNTPNTNFIARWDGEGTSFTSIGGGITATHNPGNLKVQSLAIYRGNLYVGGIFNHNTGDGNFANSITFWDGVKWYRLHSERGNGIFVRPGEDGGVKSMLVWQNPSNNTSFDQRLYIAGGFILPDAPPENNRYIGYWAGPLKNDSDKTNILWHYVGGNFLPGNSHWSNYIFSLTIFNGELYIGGEFTFKDGWYRCCGRAPTDRNSPYYLRTLSWDSKWSETNAGHRYLDRDTSLNKIAKILYVPHNFVHSLLTTKTLSGEDRLFVGTNKGIVFTRPHIWENGKYLFHRPAHQPSGSNVYVSTMLDTYNNIIYLGGHNLETNQPLVRFEQIGAFDGKFESLGWVDTSASVSSLAYANREIFVGGSFTNIQGNMANRNIARLVQQGSSKKWEPIDSGVNGRVYALLVAPSLEIK